jgi:hypothetical protein
MTRDETRHTDLIGVASVALSLTIMQSTISTFFKTAPEKGNKRSISPIDLTGDDSSLQHVSKKPKCAMTQLDQWSFTSSVLADVESPEITQNKRLRHELFKNKLLQTDLSSWHKELSQDDTHSIDEDDVEEEEIKELPSRSHRETAALTRKGKLQEIGKPHTPLEKQVGLNLQAGAHLQLQYRY